MLDKGTDSKQEHNKGRSLIGTASSKEKVMSDIHTVQEVNEFTGLIKASAASTDETTAVSLPQLVMDIKASIVFNS